MLGDGREHDTVERVVGIGRLDDVGERIGRGVLKGVGHRDDDGKRDHDEWEHAPRSDADEKHAEAKEHEEREGVGLQFREG